MQSLPSNINIRNDGNYEREHFDHFLKKVGFSFSIPSIHIAGTNGKGSVANFLFNIYKSAGYKVGLFTSPSYYELNEMIKVNDSLITDEEINAIINDELKLINKNDLSLFEIFTYVGLTHFKKCNCDIVIVECGMGGLIDATNIFDADCSVITSVSLEHTMFLGKTLSEIAYQKAGIISQCSNVVLGNLPQDALTTIMDVALEKKCKVVSITEASHTKADETGYVFSYEKLKDIRLNTLANYSIVNATLAIEAVNCMQEKLVVKPEQIIEGLGKTNLFLRMMNKIDDKLVFFDGAHNPDAMNTLGKALLNRSHGKPIHALFACFKDKNLASLLSELGNFTNSITLTTFEHNRARGYEDYFLFADEYEFNKDAVSAFKELKEKYPEDIILVTGSIAFAAYMVEALK